jgi:hypothetical protein
MKDNRGEERRRLAESPWFAASLSIDLIEKGDGDGVAESEGYGITNVKKMIVKDRRDVEGWSVGKLRRGSR